MSTPITKRYESISSIPVTTSVGNAQQGTVLHRLNPQRWLIAINENIPVPRWLVIAVLPTLFVLIIGLFGFAWNISNAISRIDQRGIDQDRAIKEIDTRGKLTDEHQRQLEKDFAEFNGWQRGRAGEQYRPPSPRRDDRNDLPQQ